MLYPLVVGAVLGFVGCLYFLVLKRGAKKSDADELKGQSIYINLLVVDKTEAVATGVTDKLQSKVGHGFFRDKITTKIGQVVGTRISDDIVAKKMAEKMVEMIPSRMREMGLTGTATKVWGPKNAFFVIKLTN